ncbi:Hypothetical_protein [Hexamita inflata]|uniref:Hypothetical_protein n=1 Tax=Hexamita inflata TaxID=28002 RepID=A0AA86QM88_9EUKA|nr:Hypothetical protein HINF_LOCUS48538 [Hexamita inflata]
MLLCGILNSQKLLRQILYDSQASICNNQVSFNNNVHQMISFCNKQSYLNQLELTGSIIISKPNLVFHSLYTETVQNVVLNINYKMTQLYSFALFGVTTEIMIYSSILSVQIPQQLAQSALVCFSCYLHVSSSEFAFAAFGQNISGLVLNQFKNIVINESLIQFRLSGVNVGGLLLQSKQSLIQMVDVNISGYVSAQNVSGLLIAFVPDVFQILVSNSQICSNIDKYAGLNLDNLQLVGLFIISCDTCRSKTYAYGLCSTYLENGELIDNKLVCKNSFEFNGEQCQCPQGQVLNGSLCINVLNTMNKIILRTLTLTQSIKSLNVSGLETKVKELENIQQQISVEIEELQDLDEEIQNNIILNSSSIQNYIVLNTTNVLNNLERNTTILDLRIYNNVTILNNQFKNFNQIFNDINSSTTILKDDIQAHVDSSMILQQNVLNLSTQIQTQNNDIMLQQQVLTNLSRKISCMNDNSSYQQCPCYFETQWASLVYDVCICIPGASSLVGGFCVCIITGQSIVGGVCICPAGSTLSGSTCVCNVAGSELKQNKCFCTKDYKSSAMYWNGGNYWCQDLKLCCSTNDNGPFYTCSNGQTYSSRCNSSTYVID